MHLKKNICTLFVVGFVLIGSTTALAFSPMQALAITCPSLNGTVTAQQGAVCLPSSDPSGVYNSIPAKNQSLGGVIAGVIEILLFFSGFAAAIFLIWGGYRYIFSRGDDKAAESGRKTITYALIGLVVVILAFTIVGVVINTTQNLNNPTSMSCGSDAIPCELGV